MIKSLVNIVFWYGINHFWLTFVLVPWLLGGSKLFGQRDTAEYIDVRGCHRGNSCATHACRTTFPC